MALSPVKDQALSNFGLLESVVDFKQRFYPRGWARYDLAKPDTFQLLPTDHILSALRRDYAAMEHMIFGKIPEFDEIIRTLGLLQSEINSHI